MAKNKIERIDQEITKVREKIAEYQEFQTVHQEQSCWAVFLFGGDAYSVSAFQNYHR